MSKEKKTKEVKEAESRIARDTDARRALKAGGHSGLERRSGISDRRGTWPARLSSSNTAGGIPNRM